MKTIITILICALCITAFGQQQGLDVKHTPIAISSGDWTNTFSLQDDMVLRNIEFVNHTPVNGKVTGDTLEIKDNSIHYIKIGNQVFEIKRSVELVQTTDNPVKTWFEGITLTPNKAIPYNLPITADNFQIYPNKAYQLLSNNKK